MGHLMAQVRIPRDTALPEDISINTFHFNWDTVAEPSAVVAAGQVSDQLDVFYHAIDNLLSSKNASPIECRVYNMDDPEPRAPVLTEQWSAMTYGTTFLPSEVAICLTFQGVAISGEPQARRRGRVYLGPLADVMASDVGDASIAQSVLDQIAIAASALATPDDDVAWCVYSRTDDALIPVDNGWLDNAFDTMRSRGMRATSRTTWT